MFGNAVCPPVMTALDGAALSEIMVDDDNKKTRIDWRGKGLEAAMPLSLEAVLECRRKAILHRLVETNTCNIVKRP